MKAFLLAGGLGSRLRPLTDRAPKCLLPVAGKPMLDIWLDNLAGAGVDEVLVNTHHLAGAVEAHLEARTGAPRVRISHEPELLGSAGTLWANRDWVQGEEMFLVCYADNLTDFDVDELVVAQRKWSPAATLALFHAPKPSACGIVELGTDGVVTSFVEKPEHPSSDLANAGLYAFSPEVLDQIGPGTPKDIGYHLLPLLVGRARGIAVEGYFLDIGTHEAYERAQADWQTRQLR
ncbi:MAG TPA: nucleotidyltransferase family protein [Acidimicrobiales bacterium]|nr:nucleotidyltransferase family protein [Acidimicrobiales bacterium]